MLSSYLFIVRFKVLTVKLLVLFGLCVNITILPAQTLHPDSVPRLRTLSKEPALFQKEIDSLKLAGHLIVAGTEFKGKTVPSVEFKELTIVAPTVTVEKKQYERYSKLSWYVRSVYPYAQLIKKTYAEIQANLGKYKTEKEQKEYIKKAEKELRERFEGELVKLSVTQGKILVKLVDRELGKSTFEVIKEFRGPFQAFVWQSLAKMFGNNLKAKYDRFGDDAMIEDIIIRIESGQ